MKTKVDPAHLVLDLTQFTGSETFTRWSPLFPRDVLTEGALYVAEKAGAYWLMDAIASHQTNPKVKAEEFQVWILKHEDAGHWCLYCEDGNYNPIIKQVIEYSDFPLPEFRLYVGPNHFYGGITILLPSEY